MSSQRVALLEDVDGTVVGDPVEWNGGGGLVHYWADTQPEFDTSKETGALQLQVDVSGAGHWAGMQLNQSPWNNTVNNVSGVNGWVKFWLPPCRVRGVITGINGVNVNLWLRGHNDEDLLKLVETR